MDSGGGFVVVSSGGGLQPRPVRPAPAQPQANTERAARDERGRLPGVETLAPVRLQRLASFLPWALVSLVLLWGGQAGDSTFDKVIGYGGAAATAAVSFRAARLRVLLGDEVVVIGWFRARRVPWKEIERFVVNKKGLAIRMRGGLEENVAAFPMGGWLFRSTRDSMRADLDRICEKAERARRARRGRK